MSATINGDGSATNDLLADVQEAAPIVKPKAPRKPRATKAMDSTVVETCRAIFAKGNSIIPHRAFATEADARKATNLLWKHTKAAAEQIVVNDKPRTSSRKVRQFTPEFRAAMPWAANASDAQYFVEFALTFTKPKAAKTAEA
jgi:hypothetical protein